MENLFEFGPFRLDVDRHLLFRGAEPVTVPAKALDTLVVLVQRHGQVVLKDELMSAVWPDAFVEEGNLSQNIHVLRRTLGETADDHRYIVTIPGKGYRFVAPVRIVADETEPPTPPGFRFFLFVKRHWGWVVTASVAVIVLGAGIQRGLPVLARSYNNQGVLQQRNGQIEQAIRSYKRAIFLRSDYAEAHYNLADVYEEIPDYAKALEEYQRAIDTDPTLYAAYNNLSRLYILRLKDPGAAEGLLDRALSLNPPERTVQYSLYKNYGWANLELQQFGRAEQNLKKAVSLDMDRGSAHCLLARALDAEGKMNEAVGEWESCVAFASQPEVEPEWRNEAQERLKGEMAK
jgi:DNA-binding winged helix-turn-helix (wHTH) protein/Flp pilus assembly protein TadD